MWRSTPRAWRPAPGTRSITILVPPGTYTVKLTVDGKDYTQPLKVLKDPHSNGTEGDIQIQNKLTTSLFDTPNHLVDESIGLNRCAPSFWN
jgi:hypothetical protein